MKGECAMSLVLEFVSCVVKNLVNVPEDVMDGWVKNPKALQKALTDALCPPAEKPARRWCEEDGVIYFEVISDGTPGPQWIERLEKKGFRLSKLAKDVLLSPDFKPTNGVTYRIAVLKGSLFTDNNRITKKIRADADRRKLEKPNAEIACLIWENFSDEEIEAMGLWWIVVMHEPIKDSGGNPYLLYASRDGDGRWLSTCYGLPDRSWGRGLGFAFAVSQVSST
jgi:hypothetical protein